MNIINTFVHSELFFYALIVLFAIVLIIFGVVVYIECRKLKISEEQLGVEQTDAPAPKKETVEKVESTPKQEEPIEILQPQEEVIPETLSQEPEQKIENTSSLEIERLLARMKEDLKNEETNPERFEREQEEQAIISYEELVQAVKNQENMDIDSQTPISNRELEKQIEKMKQHEKEQEEKKSGFHTSQFISPVYGVQREKKQIPDLKKELNQFQHEFQFDMEDMNQLEKKEPEFSKIEEHVDLNGNDEVNKNVEFLDSLKEFRKNLE